MGEWVMCNVTFKAPQSLVEVPSDAWQQVIDYDWANSDFGSPSDGFVVHEFWGSFNYGTEGVYDTFKLTELAASGVSWQISDPGHPDWDPSIAWCGADMRFFECPADHAGRPGVFLPMHDIRVFSDQEILELVRSQAAQEFQASKNITPASSKKSCQSQLVADSILGVEQSLSAVELDEFVDAGRWSKLIALNEHTPDETIVKLAKTATRDLAGTLLSRQNLCAKAQLALVDCNGSSVMSGLLEREDLSREVLYHMAANLDFNSGNAVIGQMARHSLCDFEIAGLLPAALVHHYEPKLLADEPDDTEFAKLVYHLASTVEYPTSVQTVRDTARCILTQDS